MPPPPAFRRSSSLRLARPAGRVLALCLALSASPAWAGDAYVWVDENGVPHLSDDAEGAAAAGREASVDTLRELWGRELTGPVPPTPVGGSGSEEGRALRLLHAAVEDLHRGETARAAATLRSVLREDPRRAEAHWYLALLDRQRGRYARSESHLQSFLSYAGEDLADWRVSARRRLAALGDERALADSAQPRGELQLVTRESDHFRIELDSELGRVSEGYAERVIGYLDEAREGVSRQIGVSPLEPLGVVFYGKAAYLEAHRHRFSFQTIGFFDGRIHVSSPAHPSGGLRSLLFHEYTHAVFREQTGGDRPYWLNEGLAERIERLSRLQPPSTRTERSSLRMRIQADDWIPLRTLAPSFSGLSDEDARAAYLESVVAAEFIERHTRREQRALLLQRLGEGYSADQALFEVIGMDTDGLDRALRESLLREFPEWTAAP